MEFSTSVIILSAGFGTRMKSKIPKVLHKICGKEMLACIIDEVSKISDDIHIILYNEAELIKQILNDKYPNNNFHFHLQNHQSYPGTAGALMKGYGENPKDLIDIKYHKTLILSGDMPLVESATLQDFINSDFDITLGILELENASGYGRVVLNDDKVIEIIEEKDASLEIQQIRFANGGIYCIKKDILSKYLPILESNNKQNEFYLTDIISLARNDNCDILGIKAKEEIFIGVNSKIDLARAENLMLDKIRLRAMKNGVTLRIPQSIYIECDVEFIGECEVESNSVLKGNTKIINSIIHSNTIIENSIIENSTIGPFARIRPKSTILDSHIGNFVEIKASNLNGVKAGHLSYIGDSEIDSGTNIGAGVITCNYDGVKKHKTIIGKNVFVGSDCQLIAPLTIGSNVLIAAGSSVSRNAKDGDLVISRAKQENKSGFYYKFFNSNTKEKK
ncbi:UDP-N-acetylglucosamine diphosphorylase/glucosamine-1-phosphate N-acetyltransferase [Helicobacter sp. 16-1353]|nr:bifunctional UDP-N-acetylglucosamine diphosphorylase/glucosamine-1-phosphate N-acetyltransferase GlmU [Helicobacter sp. 16-1353]RAX54514.1 UDP-N-acetylglucosamine diphosphorylase/glucosamine-1-phosphate N-acetyltransferase [Helicobacter sp. 16-1353]